MSDKVIRKKVVFLVGPTAVGKTEVAVILAKKISAEIVSCDSMQIYRGMDIVTSKVTFLLRKGVPHHLLNLISPEKEFNAAFYRRRAINAIGKILKKKKVPLFVGGTGLYMSILVDGIFNLDACDEKIRKRLYEEASQKGSKQLYDRLKQLDPQAAVKIHPNDTKRIVRALEVCQITGKPISELQKQRKGLAGEYDLRMFCLNMEREKLYRRIDGRVEKMFEQGLLEEIRGLLKLKLSKTATVAIGVKELRDYLAGLSTLEEAKVLMKKNTRNYAKRQLTWFKKDKRIQWVEINEKESPEEIAGRIYKLYRGRLR